MNEEKSDLQQLEEEIKKFWKKCGNNSVIAAKHTEFAIEPRVFIGDKLNPEILKLLVMNYLVQTSKQDSGMGADIKVFPDKLIINDPKGRPLIIVRDRKLIQQYLVYKQAPHRMVQGQASFATQG